MTSSVNALADLRRSRRAPGADVTCTSLQLALWKAISRCEVVVLLKHKIVAEDEPLSRSPRPGKCIINGTCEHALAVASFTWLTWFKAGANEAARRRSRSSIAHVH
jgi:hypothetical protein